MKPRILPFVLFAVISTLLHCTAWSQVIAEPVPADLLSVAPYKFAGMISSNYALNGGTEKTVNAGSGVCAAHPRVALTNNHVIFDSLGAYPKTDKSIPAYSWANRVRWHGTNAANTKPVAKTGQNLEVVQNANYVQFSKEENRLKSLIGDGKNAASSLVQLGSNARYSTNQLDIAALVATSNLAGGHFANVLTDSENSALRRTDTTKLLLGFPGYRFDDRKTDRMWNMHALGPMTCAFDNYTNYKNGLVPLQKVQIWGGNSGGPWFVKGNEAGWHVAALVARGSGLGPSVASESSQTLISAAIKRAGGPPTGGGGTDELGNIKLTLDRPAAAMLGENIGDSDNFTFTITKEDEYEIFSSGNLDLVGALRFSRKSTLVNDNDGSGQNFRITANIKPGSYVMFVRGAYPSERGSYTVTMRKLGAAKARSAKPTFRLDAGIWTKSELKFTTFANYLWEGNTASVRSISSNSPVVDFGVFEAKSPPKKVRLKLFNTVASNVVFAGSSPATAHGDGAYNIISQPVGVLAPGESTTFDVSFTAKFTGTSFGIIKINVGQSPACQIYVKGTGKGIVGGDDHASNTAAAAAEVLDKATDKPKGRINYGGDKDFFGLNVTKTAVYHIMTIGNTNTSGTLYSVSGETTKELETSQDSLDDFNFLIQRTLTPGRYLIQVRGADTSVVGPYQLRVTKAAPCGLLAVTGKNGNIVTDGVKYANLDDGTDFGTAASGADVIRTFALKNYGTAPLTLGNPKVSVSNSKRFSIAAQPAITSLAKGASANFKIRYKRGVGLVTSTITVRATNAGMEDETYIFRVQGGDGEAPPTFNEMVLIPAGPFQMGDQSNPQVGYIEELPVHTVEVSSFYLAKFEVTKELWDKVRAWGMDNGYTDLSEGFSSNYYNHELTNYPVVAISWHDTVKWCNARSEMENLTPCYMNGGLTYKTGSIEPDCDWSANGYRLPTEAELEKAARGGLSGKNFPWGDTITHTQANYNSSSSYNYDISLTRGYHPFFQIANGPGWPVMNIAPVNSFLANGYGLYNMSGNVMERCWDWYGSDYYSEPTSGHNPHGPSFGPERVLRGGYCTSVAYVCRVACRIYHNGGLRSLNSGFRPARSSVP